MVRDLVGTVRKHKAEMGLLIVVGPVTKGMREVAEKSGIYANPLTGAVYPKVQIATVPDLLAHKNPKAPTPLLPYVKTRPAAQSVATTDVLSSVSTLGSLTFALRAGATVTRGWSRPALLGLAAKADLILRQSGLITDRVAPLTTLAGIGGGGEGACAPRQ